MECIEERKGPEKPMLLGKNSYLRYNDRYGLNTSLSK